MYGYAKSRPTVSGIQKPGAAPCGTKIPVKRVGAGAAACNGVAAGVIDSSSGNATVAPIPRRNVRRGRCRSRDEHPQPPCSRAAGAASPTFMFIWNASLRTTPITSAVKR